MDDVVRGPLPIIPVEFGAPARVKIRFDLKTELGREFKVPEKDSWFLGMTHEAGETMFRRSMSES